MTASHLEDADVVQVGWSAYKRAMVLLSSGDRKVALQELQRARDALNVVLDHLPPECPDEEAELARRIAQGVREHVDAVVQEVSATRQ